MNNSLDNLVTVCRICHAKRHMLTKTEQRKEVVQLIDSGVDASLVTTKMGLTRQRVWQIYHTEKARHGLV